MKNKWMSKEVQRLLPEDCNCLQCGVAKVFAVYKKSPPEQDWRDLGIVGIAAVILNTHTGATFLRLYEFDNPVSTVLLECQLPTQCNYQMLTSVFHSFESDHLVVGILFSSEKHSNRFFKYVSHSLSHILKTSQSYSYSQTQYSEDSTKDPVRPRRRSGIFSFFTSRESASSREPQSIDVSRTPRVVPPAPLSSSGASPSIATQPAHQPKSVPPPFVPPAVPPLPSKSLTQTRATKEKPIPPAFVPSGSAPPHLPNSKAPPPLPNQTLPPLPPPPKVPQRQAQSEINQHSEEKKTKNKEAETSNPVSSIRQPKQKEPVSQGKSNLSKATPSSIPPPPPLPSSKSKPTLSIPPPLPVSKKPPPPPMSSVPINKKDAKAPPPPPSDIPALSESENRKISAPKDLLREIQSFNKTKLKHIHDDNDSSNNDSSQSELMQRRMRVFQESSSSDSDSIEFSD